MDDEEIARRTAWALPSFPEDRPAPPRWLKVTEIAAALLIVPIVTALAGGAVGYAFAIHAFRPKTEAAWNAGFLSGNSYAIRAHESAMRRAGVLGAEAAAVGDAMAREIEDQLAADRAAGKTGVPNG